MSAGVPLGSLLGPLFFLVYINDISSNLESDVKLFADDTSLFSSVTTPTLSATTLNNDLCKINQWAYQWKMSFNPDPTKQAQEIIFSKKLVAKNHPDLYFNQSKVKRVSAQKHLGLILDEKLNFNAHMKNTLDKVTKCIGILRKLRLYVPRHSLINMYKSFIRSQIEYADVVYDQPRNVTFCDKIESIQYNAALAITGAVRGSSMEKLYQELGLEYLSARRWYKRLCLLHKVIYKTAPAYLQNIIPQPRHLLNIRNRHLIPDFFCRTLSFSNSFFPYSINEWNKLDREITDIESFSRFRTLLVKSIKPIPNSIFGVCDPLGVQLLTRLRIGLSHLREHKFRHNFNDTDVPFCLCNLEIESVSHFYLRCPNYINQRSDLMNELSLVDPDLLHLDQHSLINLLLYGKKSFSDIQNTRILEISIQYIKDTKRFDCPLF